MGEEELVKGEGKKKQGKGLPATVELVVAARIKKSRASKIMKTPELKLAEKIKCSHEQKDAPPAHGSSRSCLPPMPPLSVVGRPEKRASSNSDERPASEYLTY